MTLKVVVTGASTGIGRATVVKFAKDGHTVFATARSDSKLAETVRLAEEASGSKNVFKYAGDVGVESDVQKVHAEALKALGGNIDVLVVNAGTITLAQLEDFTVKNYDDMFDTNVRGVFLWIKAVLPAFKKRGAGQIVIMNSVLGLAPLGPTLTLYTASKFAVTGLAQALRVELQGTGIKVGSVHPGPVDTPIYSDKERDTFGIDKNSLSADDVAGAVTTIAYQSSRSDIDKISLWPMAQK